MYKVTILVVTLQYINYSVRLRKHTLLLLTKFSPYPFLLPVLQLINVKLHTIRIIYFVETSVFD